MAPNGSSLSVLTIGLFFVLFLNNSPTYCFQSDSHCLKSIKASLHDPLNNLGRSWNFDNETEGFICRFVGIQCWHPDQSKVLNIDLSDMGLQGEFPRGVANCTSLTGLNLSGNKLHGNIPSNISGIFPFATNLDLSSNQFSGKIPSGISRCVYLNVLRLDKNQLSGKIPAEIGQLGRIKVFNVANNRLKGQVPIFRNGNISADSYANNTGLCGRPLPPCRSSSNKTHG